MRKPHLLLWAFSSISMKYRSPCAIFLWLSSSSASQIDHMANVAFATFCAREESQTFLSMTFWPTQLYQSIESSNDFCRLFFLCRHLCRVSKMRSSETLITQAIYLFIFHTWIVVTKIITVKPFSNDVCVQLARWP